MKKSALSIFKTVLKLLITAVILYFVFTKIEIDALWNVLQEAKIIYLIPALLVFVLSKWMASERLYLLLASLNPAVTRHTNLKLYLLGMFYNLFLPGGIGGDGYKIFLLHRNYQIETKKAFWGILVDRFIGMASLFILAIVFSSMILVDFYSKHWILFLIPLFLLLYVFLFQRLFAYFKAVKYRILLYSFVVQSAQIFQVLLIMAALGIHSSIPEYLVIFLISGFVSILPITVGGVGARELTFLLGSQWLGLNQEAAVSVSILFYLMTALTSLAGFYFHLRPGDIRLEQKK